MGEKGRERKRKEQNAREERVMGGQKASLCSRNFNSKGPVDTYGDTYSRLLSASFHCLTVNQENFIEIHRQI